MGIPASASGATGVSAAWAGVAPEPVRPQDPAPAVPRPPPPALPNIKERDPTIETLRGLAIVCIVIGHVIGDLPDTGMAVEANSIYRWWHETTRYVRTPMFFVIAGFLYAQRPVVSGKFAEFARGKARLLVLPFLSVATLQFLLKAFTPGVNVSTRLADIWQIYLYGFDQFWFSQAAICTFVTVLIFEKTLPFRHPYRWPVYVLLALVFEFAVPKVAIFSVPSFAQMLPLFFLGCVLHGPPATCRGPLLPLTASLVFVVSATIHQLVWFDRLRLTEGQLMVLLYSESFSFFYLLFRYRWTGPRLAVLGGFAYAIYLFHVFGTAGSRIALGRLGIHDRLIVLTIGTLCGLVLPVAIDLLFRESPVLRRVFLGGR